MKKVYEKPMILFEDFTISTNIAAGCERKIDTQVENVCGIDTEVENIIIFVEGVGSMCTFSPPDGKYDGFCYHAPEESYNLFNS